MNNLKLSTLDNPHSMRSIPFSLFAPNQNNQYSFSNEHIEKDFYPYFEYNINEHGFRYTEPSSDNIMLAAGCSLTFGTGLPIESTYSSIVSKKLGYDVVNVALPGTGPDIQILNATWALLKYKPKILLFYMSTPNRRFLATETDFMNWVPGYDTVLLSDVESKTMAVLDSKFQHTRYLQTVWQLYPLIELCKITGTKMYFKCWDPDADLYYRKYLFIQDVNELPNINHLDRARDNMHPGIESHIEYSQRILDVIEI